MQQSRLLSVPEAARLTGKSQRSIRSRIERGTLPVERRGRTVLVPLVSLYEQGLITMDAAATVSELLDRLEAQAKRIGELEAELRKREKK